jgi:hypothetical protein
MIVLLTGLAALNSHPSVSPFDELQHLDSTYKASQGIWLLPVGERVGEYAMRTQACRGIDVEIDNPPCDARNLKAEQFQERGINTVANRPSLYYVVTGYSALVISALTGQDFFNAARTASLLAWAAGAALIALLATMLSRSGVIGASAGIASGMTYVGLMQAITVNPDSWSLLVGAVVIAVSVSVARLRWQFAALTLFAVLITAVTIKQNFIVLGVIPIAFAIPLLTDRAKRVRFGSYAVATIASGLVYVWINRPVAVSPEDTAPMATYLASGPDNPWLWPEVFTSILEAVVPAHSNGVVLPLTNPATLAISTAVGLVMLSAVIAGLTQAARSSRQFLWSSTTLLVLIAGPVLIYAGEYVAGQFFVYPIRYSLVAVPLLALTWARVAPRRPIAYAVPAMFAVTGVAVGLLSLS